MPAAPPAASSLEAFGLMASGWLGVQLPQLGEPQYSPPQTCRRQARDRRSRQSELEIDDRHDRRSRVSGELQSCWDSAGHGAPSSHNSLDICRMYSLPWEHILPLLLREKVRVLASANSEFKSVTWAYLAGCMSIPDRHRDPPGRSQADRIEDLHHELQSVLGNALALHHFSLFVKHTAPEVEAMVLFCIDSQRYDRNSKNPRVVEGQAKHLQDGSALSNAIAFSKDEELARAWQIRDGYANLLAGVRRYLATIFMPTFLESAEWELLQLKMAETVPTANKVMATQRLVLFKENENSCAAFFCF